MILKTPGSTKKKNWWNENTHRASTIAIQR